VELDDATLALLHELRIRGMFDAGTTSATDTLVAAGYAVRKRSFLSITASGREVHAEWARCAAGSPDETALRVAYERFLQLNEELLRVCHDWQVNATGAPNAHDDPEYDWLVIDRLRALHERTSPVTRSMTRVMARFTPYRTRLHTALHRVEQGENEWFTSPRLDSYHTVWMQLHEDLLLALGLDRASEPEVRA
jgi:hypothetical protein